MSCIVVERQASLWKKIDKMENFPLEGGHYGNSVDAVLLMDVCIKILININYREN